MIGDPVISGCRMLAEIILYMHASKHYLRSHEQAISEHSSPQRK